MNNRIAVYAGTFDPVTHGHLEVLRRAVNLYDEVIVAVAGGEPGASTKKTLFTSEERTEFVSEAVRSEFDKDLQTRIKVMEFSGMLVDLVKEVGSKVIVRGLRAVSDYEYETQMAYTNRMLAADIETIFLVTSEPCSFISSSIVRNVALNGGDVSQMVPSNVLDALARVQQKIS